MTARGRVITKTPRQDSVARQNRETKRVQILAKLFHRLKADSADPGRARLFQIYFPVVNEQRFRGCTPSASMQC